VRHLNTRPSRGEMRFTYLPCNLFIHDEFRHHDIFVEMMSAARASSVVRALAVHPRRLKGRRSLALTRLRA